MPRTISLPPRAVLVAATIAAAASLGSQRLPAQRAQRDTSAQRGATGTMATTQMMRRLAWRSIGPANQAGRVSVVVGVPGDPMTFYVAGANGGVFKTTNAGVTFEPVFDKQDVLSIGAVAIAPSDPNVLYVGTGEGNPRNNASFGDGVYRSLDAGKNWTHVGLEDSDKIARIVIDPRNPDIAYACALGHEWGSNEQRGLFKTIDGGGHWTKVLYRNTLTGCSDVAIDPTNASIVYAGMYSFLRKAWHLESGGGETAPYKSVDGGATWKKLTRGLPRGPMDRIGLAVAQSDPSVVYMVSETTREGELWRSADAGESWQVVSRDPNINFRPFYYSDIRVDPQDPDRVYSLSGSLYLSEDGGRRFQRIARDVHGDHQALWIDPTDPRRVLSGSDGGFQISYDRAKTFEIINTIAFTQFYHLTYDMQTPYMVCGGLQDNGHWCGPSRTPFSQGIRKRDWYTVSGGDGFFAVPDLSKPYLVYTASQGGNIIITDTRTGTQRSIHPDPNRIGSAGDALAAHKYRFNWNAPIALSPQDPKTVYFGGNVLFKSTSYGQSWEVISPDLTTNDKTKQGSSGGPVVVDNTAAEFHSTLLTIAPSPKDANVIWTGSDDGNVQVTRDGGKTWTNVIRNFPGLAPNAWVSAIDASPSDAATAYVALDHHQENDYAPYAFKTTDYGRTWRRITGGLPARGWVHVVREDPRNKNLLYAGTELGIYASWDGGDRWESIRGDLPPVPVRDLFVHPRDNDLVIGTHGRGAYILDDVTPLQQLADARAAAAYLYDVRPSTRFAMWQNDANLGQKEYVAKNPPYGALITYYLRTKPRDTATITVADKSGKVIRQIRRAPSQAGVNRAVWDLRYDEAWQTDSATRADSLAKLDSAAAVAPPDSAAALRARARADTAADTAAGAGARGARGADSAARGGDPAEQGDETPAGRAGPAEADEFRPRGQGPLALPGDYTVTVRAGGAAMTKTVRVLMDPRIQVAEADLMAQLDASLAMRDLESRVNRMVARADDLTGQLTALSRQLRESPATSANTDAMETRPEPQDGKARNGPAPGDTRQVAVRDALSKLKALRDDKLTRPIAGLGYRQYPRLRDEVQSLSRAISGPISPPTESQQARRRELLQEAEAVEAELNGIVGKEIARVNELMRASPRIFVGTTIM
ncbi:MAG: hypothetical protein WKG32_17325 [Gemmatimonadaceae bacterium]